VATLAAAIAELEQGFQPGCALGVLVLDASALRALERSHGGEAYRRALEQLAELVETVNREACGGRERVAAGALGRAEVVVFLLREDGGRGLLRSELPTLVRALLERLAKHGNEIAAPYCARLPELRVGRAVALRHPQLWVVSQVRDVLEQARADAELNQRVAQREAREQFLDVLLERQLRSVFEPIVSASSLTVFGYEALVRGPAAGPFSSAASLFGAAEEHELIYELDALCCEAALEGAIDLPGGAKLFMNIRPASIQDPRFQPAVIVARLARCGLRPSDVVLEISERESIENYSSFRKLRDSFRELGFQFALDDTGAGYASLEAVLEIAPDFIKVDRAFVRGIDEDLDRQAMFSAFREAARSVNARLIGEGLDRIEELQMLAKLGIDLGQGWLFGRPTPLRAEL
jgi:EAL domain-containing protein (putative c-di-GMP-specific phosphodiesterase class I)